ncbi:MAG: hypothetical protein RLY97_1428 [Pseudomonadota bacterium]|jgi:pilus assembly protein CpaC
MRFSPFSRAAAFLACCGTLALASAFPEASIAGPTAPRVAAKVGQMPSGSQRPTKQVFLSTGEGELITLPVGIAHVWTSNPAVADVYVSNARQIHLFGKDFGEATVFATSASGAVIYAASVMVAQNVTNVDRVLKAAMPNANIKITMVGQFALLTGTVASPEDSAQAAQLVTVALNPGVKVGADGLKIGIINRLRTAVPLQVNLRVRFAEVSRSLMRTINSNLASRDNTNGFVFGVTQGASSGTVTGLNTTGFPLLDPSSKFGYAPGTLPLTPFDPVAGQFVRGDTFYSMTGGLSNATRFSYGGKLLGQTLLSSLDLGEQVGLVTTLAQPNLTAVSGETADFLAGGEFPIPLSSGLGNVSIEYKKYGVSLSYTPTVLSDGRISLRVRPEVSELSTQGAVSIGGYSIPALTTRRAETTIELGSGQSFMIAGLMSNNTQRSLQKVPGAADVPILGALFRSTGFQKGETELVIVVTPYLVSPVSDADIKLPTDGLETPNIMQQVFGNQLTAGKSGAVRPGPTSAEPAAPNAKIGMLEDPQTPMPATPDANTAMAVAAMTPATPKLADAKPDRDKKSSSKSTEATAPGFSLN